VVIKTDSNLGCVCQTVIAELRQGEWHKTLLRSSTYGSRYLYKKAGCRFSLEVKTRWVETSEDCGLTYAFKVVECPDLTFDINENDALEKEIDRLDTALHKAKCEKLQREKEQRQAEQIAKVFPNCLK
jgi:hypothetical protein